MAAPNNERGMEEKEEVVIIYELVTVESSGEEAEGNMTEEEDNMTEEEEDSMEEEEDGDEPEDYEDSMMEEEDVFYSSGEEGSLMEEEEGDIGEEPGNEEGEVVVDQEGVEYYVSDEEEDEDMLEEAEAGAEVRPEGVGMDEEEVDGIVWAEGVTLEERVLDLQRRLWQSEDSVRQWEEFHRQSLRSGAYIGCSRAATISAHGGWPVVQAFLDGDGVRLIAAILAVAIVLAAYIVAALSRVIMTALVLRGLV